MLVTSAVACTAGANGLGVTDLGPHRLRNVPEPVELFEIGLSASEHPNVIDPVCRMRVEPATAAGSLCHAGQRFWCCSMPCVAAFAADPGRYLTSASRGEAYRARPRRALAAAGMRSCPVRWRW